MAPRGEAFRQGLRELSYVEGKNIIIEWAIRRWEARSTVRADRRVSQSPGRSHRHGWWDRNARRYINKSGLQKLQLVFTTPGDLCKAEGCKK
jgi:hypothetical protein